MFIVFFHYITNLWSTSLSNKSLCCSFGGNCLVFCSSSLFRKSHQLQIVLQLDLTPDFCSKWIILVFQVNLCQMTSSVFYIPNKEMYCNKIVHYLSECSVLAPVSLRAPLVNTQSPVIGQLIYVLNSRVTSSIWWLSCSVVLLWIQRHLLYLSCTFSCSFWPHLNRDLFLSFSTGFKGLGACQNLNGRWNLFLR